MRRRVWLAGILACVLVGGAFALPATADRGGPPVRLIVVTDPASPPAPSDFFERGATDFEPLEFVANTVVVVVPQNREGSIARMDGVLTVDRDFVVRAQHHRDGHGGGPPDNGDDDDGDGGDNGESAQELPWGVDQIDAPDAWGTATGTGTTVCVADTGIDGAHEDLNVVGGRNFTRGSASNWDDKNGHGTHVAGTVAALDNTVGVVGVAHQTGLLAAKVLDNSGSGMWSWVINGLNWCESQGADVINMSFGASSSNTDVSNTLNTLTAVLVAASGNSGGSTPIFPANHPAVIAVGATDSNDSIASWSNRGEDVNAPGVSILSTLPGDKYGTASGTSMAAPHASGVAALLRQCDGGIDTADVRDTLEGTAETNTRINAASAVVAGCV